MRRLIPALTAVLTFVAPAAWADVALPHVFGDHMVVQRGRDVPVWGTAEAGEDVSVAFRGATRTAQADADGRWRVDLPASDAGGPFELVVTGKNEVRFEDVLVGEVWFCSGQSNMAMTLAAGAHANEHAQAADTPAVRMITIGREHSVVPLDDVDAAWQVCTPETVRSFSAVAYFFGRKIHDELGVPVGLINSSWGGTRIEPWATPESLRGVASLAEDIKNLTPERIAAIKKEFDDWRAEKEKASAEIAALEADDELRARMAAADLDDAHWETMPLPRMWEKAGLPGFDGLVWFRKTVDIPADWAGKDLVMQLGPIDEADVTSFAGAVVGATGSFTNGVTEFWNAPRKYRVPGELVQGGPTVIAVRVIDSAYAGGLWGGKPADMRIAPADEPGAEAVSLADDWRYLPGPQLPMQVVQPISHQTPTAIYNGMVHPVVPYGIRGTIWYQGESNAADGYGYREKFEALIRGWREVWGQGAFPFYYVQIAPYMYGTDDICALWQAQLDTLVIENTGMAVITDIANVRDIHPRNKHDVGRRLALWALKHDYGQDDLVCSGPLLKSATVEGDGVRLTFDHVGGGLQARADGSLSWFDIAGKDGAFRQAQAKIQGESVLVTGVENPAYVRFGWSATAEPRLINAEGLPASPFTTEPQAAAAP